MTNRILKMRTITWILFAVAIAAAGAHGLPTIHDGNWWCEQAPDFKRAYILGALDHAAPNMNQEVGLSAQWIGPDVQALVDRYDAFYALSENRTRMVQEILPLMLCWLAAGPGVSLEDAIRTFRGDHGRR